MINTKLMKLVNTIKLVLKNAKINKLMYLHKTLNNFKHLINI